MELFYEGLLQRATTPTDRWIIGISAVLIVGFAWHIAHRPAGQHAIIQRDNQTILTLPLTRNTQREVAGRLGPVTIEVENGRVRLLEYASSRMIGTRSGWISAGGAMVACIPCGILVRVEGSTTDQSHAIPFDGIAR